MNIDDLKLRRKKKEERKTTLIALPFISFDDFPPPD